MISEEETLGHATSTATLLSWQQEGGTLLTTNKKGLQIGPPDLESETLPGAGLGMLIERHVARSSSRRVVALDGAEFHRRRTRYVLDVYEWLHQKGIAGPLEELPDAIPQGERDASAGMG